LAADTFITDLLKQAALGFGINAVYLYVFEKKSPMLMHPSAWLDGKNLFHVIELLLDRQPRWQHDGHPRCSRSSPRHDVRHDLRRVQHHLHIVRRVRVQAGPCEVGLASSANGLAGMDAWDHQVKMIDETDTKPAARVQMAAELRLIKEKTTMALE